MNSLLPKVFLLCGLALLPLESRAQSAPPQSADPLDLGRIPIGEERVVRLTGRLNLETATQEQVMAANRRILFAIGEDSGFCLALEAPGDPAAVFLIGRESPGAPILFDVNTGLTGISNAQGRRTLARSVAPLGLTTLFLEGVVGQTASAPGEQIDVVLRAYPDTTPVAEIEAICGPTLR